MNASSEVIAAVVTPPGVGAVAMIRMSGSNAFVVAEKLLKRFSTSDVKPRLAVRDDVLAASGELLDDVIVVSYEGPRSFTGENVVEIACHGGLYLTQALLQRCLECGARMAEGGEFSMRAFMNGKMDLTQAEAIMDLISAQTDLAARAAREQLSGNLGDAVASMREEIISLTAHVEAYIDFPEEDIAPEVGEELQNSFRRLEETVEGLLGTARRGRLLREGARVAIVGAPNAGKSSLLNALLGYERALVSSQAGTTRDTVEEVLDFGGIPVRLIDTAGLREAGGEIERAGMERARLSIEQADLTIELVDGSQPVGERFAEEALLVLSKSDLGEHSTWEDQDVLRISVATEKGIEELRELVATLLLKDDGPQKIGTLVAINGRHQECLRRSLHFLQESRKMLVCGDEPEFVSLPLREALEAVGEIAGKIETEEILGSIFSQFCIGK